MTHEPALIWRKTRVAHYFGRKVSNHLPGKRPIVIVATRFCTGTDLATLAINGGGRWTRYLMRLRAGLRGTGTIQSSVFTQFAFSQSSFFQLSFSQLFFPNSFFPTSRV